MITREEARRIWSHPHKGNCRCIKPTERERLLAETILFLYERIEGLEQDLGDAAYNQCGCLGGTISQYDVTRPA